MEPTSPLLSDSSDDEAVSAHGEHEGAATWTSRPGSPAPSYNGEDASDSVTCQWGDDCGLVCSL